jgi:hypothetical protein
LRAVFCSLEKQARNNHVTFQKGQSGNPHGRPRIDQSVTPHIRRLLQEKRAGRTRAEHVATTLVDMAENGDLNAIRTVLERIDGKVMDQVDVTTNGEALLFGFDFKGRNAEAR